MILREATIQYKDYDPEDLSKGSHKRICVSCDMCGRVKYSEFKSYSKLCASCSQIGEKNHRFGSLTTEETKQKMRNGAAHLSGKNHHLYGKTQTLKHRINHSCSSLGINLKEWKDFKSRNHVKREHKCIKLNERFLNCEMHHVISGVVIYIPKCIHQSIKHNMRNGKNMNEINKLAYNYLRGEF